MYNEKFMDIALNEAKLALEENEVPVGAVIVKDSIVLAVAYNQKETKKSVIYHAEILAINEASSKVDNWRLDGCDMYVTLEPCPMCAGAIKQARIKNVYSALSNSDKKNSLIIKQIFDDVSINPKVEIFNDLAVERSTKILTDFFKQRRKK